MREVGLKYCFVVEPQDKEAYASYGATTLTLPENDKGITYSRNFILNHCRKIGYQFFWMLDDDIENFGEVINGKTVKTNAEVLCKAFNQMAKFEFSMASLELRQFAWSSKELTQNRTAMQCVLFNVKNCKDIDYDLNILIREDYDLTFQAITKGFGTLKTAKYYYGIADMKSQEGGMSQWYNEEREKKEVEKLCKKWGGLVEPEFKKNRRDVKINWRKLK